METPEPERADAPVAAVAPSQSLLTAPRAGIALLGGRRFDATAFDFGPFAFWGAVVAAALAFSASGWFQVDPPWTLSVQSMQAQALLILAKLLALHLLLPAPLRRHYWSAAALLIWAGVIPDALLMDGGAQQPFERAQANALWPWICGLVYFLWQAAILNTLLKNLGAARREQRLLCALAAAAFSTCLWYSPVYGLIDTDYSADDGGSAGNEPAPEPVYPEELFPQQAQMLAEAFNTLAPRTPGRSNLWFLGFAPYASQDVFVHEGQYAQKLFTEKFGAAGHSLLLANHREHLDELPLASVTNLAAALTELGQRMNREEDILFLYLTSHGGSDGEIALNLAGERFVPLNPQVLKTLLQKSGIRWKVIVVSACYSGQFVKPLAAPDTVVITAARPDRTSFGCSDDADMTYFGRAYFQNALAQTHSFTQAFGLARKEIEKRESEEGYEHAEPQMAAGKDIAAKLKAAGY